MGGPKDGEFIHSRLDFLPRFWTKLIGDKIVLESEGQEVYLYELQVSDPFTAKYMYRGVTAKST